MQGFGRRCAGRWPWPWPSPFNFVSSRPSSSHGAAEAVGEVLKMEHSFAQEDVESYALLSGDSNPIHTSPAYASSHGFRSCVVHGMLSASLFPTLIASRFPGARIASQTLRFKEPALVGDCLEAEAKVVNVSITASPMTEKFLSIELNIECFKKEGRVLVLEGKSKVLAPEL